MVPLSVTVVYHFSSSLAPLVSSPLPSLGTSSVSQIYTKNNHEVNVQNEMLFLLPSGITWVRWYTKLQILWKQSFLILWVWVWEMEVLVRRECFGFLSSCWKKLWIEVSPYGSDSGWVGKWWGLWDSWGSIRKVPHLQWHIRFPRLIQWETGALIKSHLVWWCACTSLINLQNIFFEASLKQNHITRSNR